MHELASQRECVIEEGHLMPDHVHMLISIPPKYSVSRVIGFIKGKSTIQVARHLFGKQWNFVGEKLWARGYFASTVGLDENVVRSYIGHQETEGRRYEQMGLFK